MTNETDRLEGKRYYDTANDESFTVLTSRHSASGLVETQYDDGVSWDEMALPDDVSEEGAEQFGVEVGGLDSERYVPLGPGPTIRRSQELCDGDHDWFPLPSHLGWDDPEVWYSGIDSAKEDLGAAYCRPVELYNLMARCKRCGLSADAIISFTGDDVPVVCMECGTDLVPGETQKEWLGDTTCCPDCADKLREREATCAECGRTQPEYTDNGELAFRFVTPETYVQKHEDFKADFSEGTSPICMNCWRDSNPDPGP